MPVDTRTSCSSLALHRVQGRRPSEFYLGHAILVLQRGAPTAFVSAFGTCAWTGFLNTLGLTIPPPEPTSV